MINSASAAPLPVIRFDLDGPQIKEATSELIRSTRQSLDRIAAVQNATFDSVIRPLSILESKFATDMGKLNFPQFVSPDSGVREASVDATKMLDQFMIEKGMRADLYKVVKEASQSLPSGLDGESKRLVDKMLLEFKLNGLDLAAEKQAELKKLRERLSELEVSFSNNMNEDKTTITFSKDELEGCPDSFLESLTTGEDGKYILTMKYPDVFGVLRNAVRESTRRAMQVAFDTKSPQNYALIQEAIKLRQECALLLGYKEHSEVRLVNKMAQTPERVRVFLTDLRPRLDKLAKQELPALVDLKQKVSKGNSNGNVVNSFDLSFLHRQLMQQRYDVDHEKIKEFFPMEHVLTEMMALYEGLLGIKFVRVQAESAPAGLVWHADVQLYEVQDAGTGKAMGHIFFDLFPRDGKYTHAACFPLQPGYAMSECGTIRQLPAAALVCNFSKPVGERPSLLGHDEVVTLFHELGHGMHDLCSKVRFGRFHGTSVEYDFVEAPSQMLENWCWEPEVLRRLSKHYQSGLPMDQQLIDALVSTKNVNSGLTNLRQLFFATFDMYVHSKDMPVGADLNRLYAKMRSDITLLPQPAESTPLCSFGHLMGGYDAGYYGYLWSQVFSADMYFSRFKQEGLFDSKCGMDYRREILQPGGSRPGMQCLEAFLGRQPTSDAFFQSIGLEDESKGGKNEL